MNKGRLVGIGAEENVLCCVKNVGEVAVFGSLTNLLEWSKLPNDASKPVYVTAGGSVGEEFAGDHERVAVNQLCW